MKLPMEPDHSAEIASLRVAKAQLIVALKIMRAANNALGCGDEEALRMMNFSQEHIAELKSRWAGGKLGFPEYTLTNNRSSIRYIQKRIKCLQIPKMEEVNSPIYNCIR